MVQMLVSWTGEDAPQGLIWGVGDTKGKQQMKGSQRVKTTGMNEFFVITKTTSEDICLVMDINSLVFESPQTNVQLTVM